MNNPKSLKDVVSFDSGFKSAVNLYLSLNNPDKVLSYIPTKSSLSILESMLKAVLANKEQASLLVGPYVKGKSLLMLVFLAIISMDRTEENEKAIATLVSSIRKNDEIGGEVSGLIETIWLEKKPFVPVLINARDDLHQAFLLGLNDALKRAGLTHLQPDTYYSIALQRLADWEENYPDTYNSFVSKLEELNVKLDEFVADLKGYSKSAIDLFASVYPEVTSGSEFNPLAESEVLPLFKSVAEEVYSSGKYSGLYIVFDEFSKYIESQDKKASGANMKLLQDVCELANESDEAQIFMTAIAHKSIKEYGSYLSSDTINAFTGIEGRLIEKLFITSSKNNYELVRNAIIKPDDFEDAIDDSHYSFSDELINSFYELPVFNANFNYQDFVDIVYKGCYPLTPLSAYLLLNISEKVAQNERTLFTFISNDEPHSMARYVSNHTGLQRWFVAADLIYDYFSGLFKREIANEKVHSEWLNAEYALSKCTTEAQKWLVKKLALILMIDKPDELPANDQYLVLENGDIDLTDVLSELLSKKIIYKKGSTGTYEFKTRAGSALKEEVEHQRAYKGSRVNIPEVLEQITGKYYVIPKKYNTERRMTRYFTHRYMLVSDFMSIEDARVLFGRDTSPDGLVLSLLGEMEYSKDRVKKHFEKLACEQLCIVIPEKPFSLRKRAIDYEILQDLKASGFFKEDKEIFAREMPLMLEDISSEITAELLSMYDDAPDCEIVFCQNGEVVSSTRVGLESAVDKVCYSLYNQTPIINNELINKRVIASAPTKKARQNIVRALLTREAEQPDFYSGTNQDATIFRSLFVRTGVLDRLGDEENKYPLSSEMASVLDKIKSFLDKCVGEKESLAALVNELTTSPIGMRVSVLPSYLAYEISKRKEDIVVYFAGSEIPLTADILINMCDAPEDYELYISEEDAQKENYIDKLNELFSVLEQKNLSENRIKNIYECMQRWYRGLPLVTRNTNDFSLVEEDEEIINAMKVLKRNLQRIETNPYEVLFNIIPRDFGFTNDLESVSSILWKCVYNYNDHYKRLLERITEETKAIFEGKDDSDLYHILKEWYAKQSDVSKNGLFDNRVTSFMNYVSTLSNYDELQVASGLAKVITDVYTENWNDKSLGEYIAELKALKAEVETIKDQVETGKRKLSFEGLNGNVIERYYEPTNNADVNILRNILEDTLDEYSDLSANDRVAVLLEMIESIIE